MKESNNENSNKFFYFCLRRLVADYPWSYNILKTRVKTECICVIFLVC